MAKKTKKDLISQLETLCARRSFYHGDMTKFTVAEISQMLNDEDSSWSCKNCGERLIVLKWNEKVDILTCDNSHCIKYRVPVGTIPVKIKRGQIK